MTGIYISFPFCLQKCTYCNFSSGVFPRDLVGPYVEALQAEMESAEFPGEPDTLYLGGGTPSLLDTVQLSRILGSLPRVRWSEATIEAAPGTITPEKAEAWARCGIHRVSLGVQSFVPREAAAASRKHTPEQVAAEIALLRSNGIAAINIDLIAGLAYQTESGWKTSLDWVDRLQPEHVSVYMLEVDDESRLGEELRSGGARYGAQAVPSEDEIAGFYEMAVERLRAMSILRYEISNFSRPGFESRHNLKYWNMEPYLGFGADAHSFDGERRWWNVPAPGEYIERVFGGVSARERTETIDDARRFQERFLTGLRQSRGLQATAAEFELLRGPLQRLTACGWLEQGGHGHVRLTPEGVLFSNTVFQELLFS